MAKRFAENLTSRREAMPLSQEELARRADIHRTRISKFENAEEMPRFETLVKIAGALGVSIADLAEGITWEPIVTTSGGMKVVTRD